MTEARVVGSTPSPSRRTTFGTILGHLVGGLVQSFGVCCMNTRRRDALETSLSQLGDSPFYGTKTHAFILSWSILPRVWALADFVRGFVTGEDVRDWTHITRALVAIFPYEGALAYAPGAGAGISPLEHFWRYGHVCGKTRLRQTIEQRGMKWFEQAMFFRGRYLATRPLFIAFAEVATHNHFVVRSWRQGIQTSAPIIKLPVQS